MEFLSLFCSCNAFSLSVCSGRRDFQIDVFNQFGVNFEIGGESISIDPLVQCERVIGIEAEICTYATMISESRQPWHRMVLQREIDVRKEKKTEEEEELC